MRRAQSLSGLWEFGIDRGGIFSPTSLHLDREIRVPSAWQAAFPDLEHYSGYAWYRREIDLDAGWLGGALLLRFGAVDYWCRVFINGELAGEHEGGYMPFTISAGTYLREGRNELVVQVYDVAQESIVVSRWPANSQSAIEHGPPFDANDIPHGKQEWYMNVGGIWQDVTLTVVPATWIEHVQVTPDIHTGRATVRVVLGGKPPSTAGGRLVVRVVSGTEKDPASGEATNLELAVGQNVYEAVVAVDQPHLWETEDPFLYLAQVSLYLPDAVSSAETEEATAPSDQVAVRFGFREISTRDGQLLLNGRPLFLRAALDQDIYPETIYTVPSEEYLRDEFRKAQELGLNCLRCHIKPPDPLYLDLADEMGLLVWTEIPSWRTFHVKGTLQEERLNLGDSVKQRVEQTLEEMVRRDYNHPSIIIWTLVNEDWGTSLPLSASDRAWVAELYDRCKALDPTRLVVDNSACQHPWGPNFHVSSDIDDFHIYANIPEQARSFERSIEEFSLRPMWTYSNHGDARRTGHEPLMLSEFGNWGLAELEKLRAGNGTTNHTIRNPKSGYPLGDRNPKSKEPRWFDMGPWWSSWEGEAGWPASVEERFMQLGLEQIWPTFDEFARATQWHQFRALKFEIEAMRRHASIAGYVITELSDIYWETNGLLNFYRNPKAYHNAFATINSADMIIPQIKDHACWDEARPTVRLYASHYDKADWSDAYLSWSVAGNVKGEAALPSLAQGEVRDLGVLRLDLPKIERAGSVPMELAVHRRGDGKLLAANSLDLYLMPSEWQRTETASDISLAVVMPNGMDRSLPIEPLERPPEGLDLAEADTTGVTGQIEPEPEDAPATRSAHDLPRRISRLGYQTTPHITADTRIVVTSRPDTTMLKWVREGGDMLALANGPGPFFWVQDRNGPYSGSWLTSFSWISPRVHMRLEAAGNPLGMPFARVMPSRTILGLPLEDKAVHSDILAGMVSGWVGHPAAHTVQFRYGKGRVIMTTFGIEQGLPDDPVAVAMFHDLIDHLSSDACRPVLKANW